MKKTFIVLAAASIITLNLQAGSIVVSQGDTPDEGQILNGPSIFTIYADAGWTTGNSSYSNVDISATLMGQDQGGDSVTAYLTTGIGSGFSSVLASNDVSVVSGSYSSVQLFSGLSLDANTSYFLTLAPDGSDSVYWGIDSNQPAPVTDIGVSIIPAGYCNDDTGDCAAPPPSSPGFTLNNGSPLDPLGANPIFSVTTSKSPGASTPEPATFLMFGAGLGGLAFLRRRRA